MRENKEFLQFNDGVADIYSVRNIALPGDMPKEGLCMKYQAIRFEYQTIGVKRHYEAMQANAQLEELIRLPMHRDISSQDVAVINGKRYLINQVQHDSGTRPPSSKLSLIRSEEAYDGTEL